MLHLTSASRRSQCSPQPALQSSRAPCTTSSGPARGSAGDPGRALGCASDPVILVNPRNSGKLLQTPTIAAIPLDNDTLALNSSQSATSALYPNKPLTSRWLMATTFHAFKANTLTKGMISAVSRGDCTLADTVTAGSHSVPWPSSAPTPNPRLTLSLTELAHSPAFTHANLCGHDEEDNEDHERLMRIQPPSLTPLSLRQSVKRAHNSPPLTTSLRSSKRRSLAGVRPTWSSSPPSGSELIQTIDTPHTARYAQHAAPVQQEQGVVDGGEEGEFDWGEDDERVSQVDLGPDSDEELTSGESSNWSPTRPGVTSAQRRQPLMETTPFQRRIFDLGPHGAQSRLSPSTFALATRHQAGEHEQ